MLPTAITAALFATLSVTVFASATRADLPPIVPDQIADRVRSKEIVVMQELRTEGALEGALTLAFVVFDHPPDRVFELLARTDRQVEFRPEVESIDRIEMNEHGPLDLQRLKILFQRYAYRLQFTLEPKQHRITWELDPNFDNDLDGVTGFWELYPLDGGRTLGRSGAQVDVGRRVPVFLQDWITRKNLPASMKRVQRWVNSGGVWRP